MNTNLSFESLLAVIAVAMLALAAGTSDANSGANSGATTATTPTTATAASSTGASAYPVVLQMDAPARDTQYYSASGEGQFTAGGRLVGSGQ